MKRIVVIAVLMAGFLMPVVAQHGVALHNQLLQRDSTLYQRSVQDKLSANSALKYGISQWKLNDMGSVSVSADLRSVAAKSIGICDPAKK